MNIFKNRILCLLHSYLQFLTHTTGNLFRKSYPKKQPLPQIHRALHLSEAFLHLHWPLQLFIQRHFNCCFETTIYICTVKLVQRMSKPVVFFTQPHFTAGGSLDFQTSIRLKQKPAGYAACFVCYQKNFQCWWSIDLPFCRKSSFRASFTRS